jgi:hypothetical protein
MSSRQNACRGLLRIVYQNQPAGELVDIPLRVTKFKFVVGSSEHILPQIRDKKFELALIDGRQ